ncbi:MAG: alcohol dehydrogenase catalytic domain-containing protein [Alphaproteobacteria bacterium]|uniref:Alcohol dehydrogenase catalytic domain-containing protein n=1 Tax=Candidatus Nitrobium versatile TaxID=2884831 RepID=A0A953M207_9BACT|nr:alcohol dehydrogenase catalytic domain-containing protein [Candidatus Nitrobium versatile]
MKAVCFDGSLTVCEREKPRRKRGEMLIRVAVAGICNTDHEITRGYIPGFSGILGHEFFGYVEEADDAALAGRRVTAEINNACRSCEFCNRGLGRHCGSRSVLGIVGRDGAMAEYVAVPQENVLEIPPAIPDSRALFIEPLAAAMEILEQVEIGKEHSVLLLGDGKLALLIALVMNTTGCDLTVVGKHACKLALLEERGIRTVLLGSFQKGCYDRVIEASGSPSAFDLGLSCIKPRGTFVLKSTYSGGFFFNPSSLVVNEITLVGSRCGRFEDAVQFLEQHAPPLEKMISREYPLEEAIAAFAYSERPDSLKVVLRIG